MIPQTVELLRGYSLMLLEEGKLPLSSAMLLGLHSNKETSPGPLVFACHYVLHASIISPQEPWLVDLQTSPKYR
jgi:hypothetical protein